MGDLWRGMVSPKSHVTELNGYAFKRVGCGKVANDSKMGWAESIKWV